MTIPDGGNKNSMLQHALVLSVREFLVDRNGEDEHGGVRCYAQDPMYTSLDQKLLKEIGVEVLADPRAFLEADETSVVFSFSPDIPVRQIITDIGRPAILVWNFVGEPRVALWLAPPPLPPLACFPPILLTEPPFQSIGKCRKERPLFGRC